MVNKINSQIKENKNHWFSSAPVEAVLRLSITATAYLNHKQFFIKQKITKKDDKFAYLSVTAAFEDEILNFAKLYLPYIKIIEPSYLQDEFERVLKSYLGNGENL